MTESKESAKPTTPKADEKWNTATTGAAANPVSEWNTVEAEQQMVFEAHGDGFIGRYLGMDPANSNGIVQGHWENCTDLNGNALGEAFFLNCGRDLEMKLRKVPAKALTRIVWSTSMDTGQRTPMRVFTVDWR